MRAALAAGAMPKTTPTSQATLNEMMTEPGDTFGVAPHLLGCRAEVIPMLDTVKDRRIWKKGMTGYAWDPPVAWPAAFNLLNFAVIEDRFPELSGLWPKPRAAEAPEELPRTTRHVSCRVAAQRAAHAEVVPPAETARRS